QQRFTASADRAVGIVMDFAAGDEWRPFVEQRGEQADQPCLRLSAQTEQDEVVPGEDRVDHLWEHGVVIAHEARGQGFTALDLADQVLADFVFNRPCAYSAFWEGTLAECAKCTG